MMSDFSLYLESGAICSALERRNILIWIFLSERGYIFSLLDETLNQGPMTIFQDKLLTRTDCDEAGDYVVPNVLCPKDLVFRPDIGHKNCTTTEDILISIL